MRTFIINLEKSVGRKKFMQLQLEALGLQHEFFPAVDGRGLTTHQLEEMCDMEVVRKWADLLTPGMIGCSLSHFRIYKKMVAEQIPFAFVLEDDIRMSKRVPYILRQIEAGFREGRLNPDEPILLYYQSKTVVDFAQRSEVALTPDTRLYHPVEIWRPITTAAYVISLQSAQRLVSLIYPIRYSPDSWAVYHREGAIAGLRCILPLPVESGFFKSDIGYELGKPLNRMVRWLEVNCVFPIPQLLQWRRRKRARLQNRFRLLDTPLLWLPKTALS